MPADYSKLTQGIAAATRAVLLRPQLQAQADQQQQLIDSQLDSNAATAAYHRAQADKVQHEYDDSRADRAAITAVPEQLLTQGLAYIPDETLRGTVRDTIHNGGDWSALVPDAAVRQRLADALAIGARANYAGAGGRDTNQVFGENKVNDGYAFNTVQGVRQLLETGRAAIAKEQAQARQADAAAGASRASADKYHADAEQTRDYTSNPAKYATPAKAAVPDSPEEIDAARGKALQTYLAGALDLYQNSDQFDPKLKGPRKPVSHMFGADEPGGMTFEQFVDQRAPAVLGPRPTRPGAHVAPPPAVVPNVLPDTIARALAPPEPLEAVPGAGGRVVGQVYPTPRGNLRWTGTGWVAP